MNNYLFKTIHTYIKAENNVIWKKFKSIRLKYGVIYLHSCLCLFFNTLPKRNLNDKDSRYDSHLKKRKEHLINEFVICFADFISRYRNVPSSCGMKTIYAK